MTGTDARISALSAVGPDGAFIMTPAPPEPGTKLGITFVLPVEPRVSVDVSATVVRRTATGAGVQFTEITSRNRALLVQYVTHILTDDSVKRLEREFGDILRGPLIPTALRDETFDVLDSAAREGTAVKLILARRRFHVCDASLEEIHGERLPLRMAQVDVPPPFSPAYVAFLRNEIQYVFETVFLAPDVTGLAVQVPDRLYSTERRARSRRAGSQARVEIDLPHAEAGFLRASVLDYDEGGFAISLPSTALVFPGAHLPRCRVVEGDRVVADGPAVVRNILPLDAGEIRVGLALAATAPPRAAFEERVQRDLRRPLGDRMRALMSATRARLARFVRGRSPPSENATKLEIVRYRTTEKEEIVGIVDRSEGATPPVDLGVVIAPALGKHKESFSLLARTIVENFQAIGTSCAVLRYDDVRSVGESANDPDCREEGWQLRRYTLGQVGRDIEASVRFLRRLANPRHVALCTVSIGSIPARRCLATKRLTNIDSWVALFGCPDAADMCFKGTSGEDLFAQFRRGDDGTKLIAGFRFEFRRFVGNAIDEGMETLEDAIADISRIDVPVTWVVGAHDYWVRRERVRQLLNAPGRGTREIFEVPTGHLVRSGDEALETFKLVAESIAKHALGRSMCARDPDLLYAGAVSRREWDRVRRPRPRDTVTYWAEHLFGKEGEKAGYDIVRTSRMYARFMEQQHELAEIGGGMKVADVGCGTGIFAELAATRALETRRPIVLTCLDLVPEATRRTRARLEELARAVNADQSRILTFECGVANLEVSRLKPIQEFLSGELHGVEALAGRIEGLPDDLPARMRASYSAELHAILRGRSSTPAELRALLPGASDGDVDAVLDLSLAARFLRGSIGPGDSQVSAPDTASDLALKRLRFPGATRRMTIDLPDGTFDRVVASLVVSYVYQPEETIAELARALRPGGILVASSLKPNFDFSETHMESVGRITALSDAELPAGETRESLLGALRGFSSYVATLLELEEQGAFRFFDAAVLHRMLARAGFEEIQVFDGLGDPGQAVIARGVKPGA